jgi:hypothetical protein
LQPVFNRRFLYERSATCRVDCDADQYEPASSSYRQIMLVWAPLSLWRCGRPLLSGRGTPMRQIEQYLEYECNCLRLAAVLMPPRPYWSRSALPAHLCRLSEGVLAPRKCLRAFPRITIRHAPEGDCWVSDRLLSSRGDDCYRSCFRRSQYFEPPPLDGCVKD